MKHAIPIRPFAQHCSERPRDGVQFTPSRCDPSRCASLLLGIFCALILVDKPALAADYTTCSMAVKLLEATDRGLEAAAAGDARGATSAIAVFTQQTQDTAERNSQNDPLPDAVTAALTAILAETKIQYFITDAAPVILEQTLLIQQAMPEICAGSEIPDLNRHVK